MNNLITQILQSSKDPEKLSMTVTGVLSSLIPAAGFLITASGHNVDNAALQGFVTAIGSAIVAVGSAVSAVLTVWGLLRKLF